VGGEGRRGGEVNERHWGSGREEKTRTNWVRAPLTLKRPPGPESVLR
jgi:hypothetical protein